jgi:hypothetical protein
MEDQVNQDHGSLLEGLERTWLQKNENYQEDCREKRKQEGVPSHNGVCKALG